MAKTKNGASKTRAPARGAKSRPQRPRRSVGRSSLSPDSMREALIAGVRQLAVDVGPEERSAAETPTASVRALRPHSAIARLLEADVATDDSAVAFARGRGALPYEPTREELRRVQALLRELDGIVAAGTKTGWAYAAAFSAEFLTKDIERSRVLVILHDATSALRRLRRQSQALASSVAEQKLRDMRSDMRRELADRLAKLGEAELAKLDGNAREGIALLLKEDAVPNVKRVHRPEVERSGRHTVAEAARDRLAQVRSEFSTLTVDTILAQLDRVDVAKGSKGGRGHVQVPHVAAELSVDCGAFGDGTKTSRTVALDDAKNAFLMARNRAFRQKPQRHT